MNLTFFFIKCIVLLGRYLIYNLRKKLKINNENKKKLTLCGEDGID